MVFNLTCPNTRSAKDFTITAGQDYFLFSCSWEFDICDWKGTKIMEVKPQFTVLLHPTPTPGYICCIHAPPGYTFRDLSNISIANIPAVAQGNVVPAIKLQIMQGQTLAMMVGWNMNRLL